MNYRHAYHAGNFADVFKHLILLDLLTYLRHKEKPFCYLDTHAGVGRYDLAGAAARRTGEYRGGIGRLYAAERLPEAVTGYVARIRAMNPADGLRVYPGSPCLARQLLRPRDRMVLCELHPQDAAALKSVFHGDRQVAVHRRDGYEALKALLPPPERRGVVLIDPPFEGREEFRLLADGLRAAHERWAAGIYALWYPIVDRAAVARFHGTLRRTGIRPMLAAELSPWPDDVPDRFNGCGMVVVNPPWQLDERLRTLLPWLAPHLADEPDQARWAVEWLAPE